MSSVGCLWSGQRGRLRGEAGVAIFEYVLLVASIAVAAIGALVYFGSASGGPVHELNSAGSAVALGGTRSGTPWCTSYESGCRVTVPVGGGVTIDFSVSGGTEPYSFSLENAPSFLSLDSRDREVLVDPARCPASRAGNYTYNGVSLLVSDSGRPPVTGRLTFSVTVTSC
ncbi:MAG: Flp family type IVb pilin [Acidimicrobiales bacterium]